MPEQTKPQSKGVTRRSFVGLAAAGIAGAIAVAAAGSKNPIGRVFGKKRTIGSISEGGSMFTQRDPQP